MEPNKLVVQISEKDLLCVTGCGFFGNPQWQGFCSKCWRNYQRQLHSQAVAAGFVDSSQSHTTSTPAVSPTVITSNSGTNNNNKSWSGLGFDKFLEKKSHQTNRRASTLRSFLRKSPSSDYTTAANSPNLPSSETALASLAVLDRQAQPQQTPKRQQRAPVKRQLSNESETAKLNFLSFLHKLPKGLAHEISKPTSVVVEKICRADQIPIDELSELVQDTYQTLDDRLRRSPHMNNCKFTISQILEEVEAYICSRCYNVLFCPSTDEEVEDLSLQDRIRSLYWVTYGFLQHALDFSNVIVKDRIDAAVTEINDINSSETTGNNPSRRHPQRKLESILQCSKLIFEALKESRGAPASADEFLPALIYVILRSNPPQLKSNTTFINRFALQTRLMTGEAGYYFTTLCCALQHVQNLNADLLRMPREEFEAYTSGQLMPPLTADSTCRASQAVKSLENSLEQLRQLNQPADKLLQRIDELERTENEGWEKIMDTVGTFRQEHPPGKSLDVAWLEASPDKEELLPPPLKPTPAAANSTGTVEDEDGDGVPVLWLGKGE